MQKCKRNLQNLNKVNKDRNLLQLLKRAAILFILMGVAVVFFATLLPSSFEVSREITIDRPIQTVYQSLADLSKWSQWDPWQRKDTNLSLKVTQQTPDQTDAVWLKDGNKAGTIKLEIKAPREELVITIENVSMPTRTLIVRLQDLGGKVRVQWTVTGENGLYPLGNIFALQMEKYVGTNYEDALKQLKSHLEGAQSQNP